MSEFKINLKDLPENENEGTFEPLPAGWYAANVTQAELKDTVAGTGKYIKLRYDITGPTHQGRVVFGNFNIANPNVKAEEIGRRQLGDFMRSAKLESIEDTDQMCGASVQIKLKVRPAKDGYEANNDVSGWKESTGAANAPAQGAPPAASAGLPWKK